jgi:hypothetical protein
MGDVQDRPDEIGEEAAWADALASMDDMHPEGVVSEPEASEVPSAAGDDPDVTSDDSVAVEAEGEPANSAVESTDAGSAEAITSESDSLSVGSAAIDAQQTDPDLAALQAELEAEDDESASPVEEAVVEEAGPESFDDIAPGTVAGEQAAVEDAKDIALPNDRAGVPVWPFLVYFALWVVFTGLLVWQLLVVPVGTPIYELDIYGLSILAGLILTAMGPLLAIGVWLAVWSGRPHGQRAGLFGRSLILGALATLAGVALWLVALGSVDMLRLGRFL